MLATELVTFWDIAIAEFLDGGSCVPQGTEEWRASYEGSGLGEVEERAFPEPYGGPILSSPQAVFLNLNPGQANLDFQGRDGLFAGEIRELGSFSAWAATVPYFRGPWETTLGRNQHAYSRLRFMQRWFENPDLTPQQMVSFELFPWHSARVTAAMNPDPSIIEEFVWGPLSGIGDPVIFAFGAPWFRFLPALGVETLGLLGHGGIEYGSEVKSRSVLVGRTARGSLVIAEKHMGSAGPPRETETARLREAVIGLIR